MDVFDLYAKISLDTSGYEKNLSGAKSLFVSAGKSISASTVAMGTMIAHGIERAASAVINLGKSAIEASSDIAAQAAQFKQTFGELEAAATGVFSQIEQDTGILSRRLQTAGTRAFAQFKGAGLDAASALSETDKYTRLAADAAAYFDITLEEADERLRSFLRGNTEAGDMINLFTSEMQRNEKAMELYGKKWLELTEAQRQMLMLDVVNETYERIGVIGQAARETDQWTNVVGNLNSAWETFAAVIGTPFREGLTPVIQKLTEFFSNETVQMRVGMLAANIGKVAGMAFDGVVSFLDKLIGLSEGTADSGEFDSIRNLLSNLSEFAGVAFDSVTGFLDLLIGGDSTTDTINSISEFLEDVSGFLADNAEVAMALIAAITALNAIKNPFSLLISALAVIATNWSDIKEFATAAVDKINSFLDTIVPDGFMQGVVDVLGSISGMISSIASAWQSLLDSMSAGVSSVQSALSGGGIGSAISSAVSDAWWNPFKSSGTSISIGERGATGSFATGLSYVPYNGFRATLHAGETVLNRADATAWRAGNQAQPVDYNALGAVVGEAVRAALDGVAVQADGQKIGELTSRNIAQNAWRRRYATI